MGDCAEDIIDGTCDIYGDYTYKSNKKRYKTKFIPDTPAEANIRAVRRELAILINKYISENPDDNKNSLVQRARRDINIKYGSGWRERGLISNSDDQWKPLNEY